MKKLRESFAHAIAGLQYAVRTQRTLRLHLVIAAAVGILIFWLQLPVVESAVTILAIALVIGAELLNTGTEAVVDLLVERNHHTLAKMAKDIAAGAVLVAAGAAAIVGLLLLGPPMAVRLGVQPSLAALAARGAALFVIAASAVGVIRLLRAPRRPAGVQSPHVGEER